MAAIKSTRYVGGGAATTMSPMAAKVFGYVILGVFAVIVVFVIIAYFEDQALQNQRAERAAAERLAVERAYQRWPNVAKRGEYLCTSVGMNLRRGPGTNYPVKATMTRKSGVVVLGPPKGARSDGNAPWVEVRVQGWTKYDNRTKPIATGYSGPSGYVSYRLLRNWRTCLRM